MQLAPAIVHIGVGGFHRAHQGLYLDDVAAFTTAWGERGIGLLPTDRRIADVLRDQDCLYTVVERDAHADSARIVGSMRDYIFAPDEPERALDALADATTQIISLTITEDGYRVDEHTRVFDSTHPSILHDLETPSRPETVFGYVVEALDRRRREGLPPVTVLSCDNLQGNGGIARTAIESFARLRSDALANWIAANVAFPDSMVDRITPQTTDAHRMLVADTFGVKDRWPVVAERYREWVIQDEFAAGHPPFDLVPSGNVRFVTDVEPYETLKLRLLNGSHVSMGYLGALAGYGQVQDVIADPLFHDFIARLMDEEIAPLLPPVPGVDVENYERTLLERFANPKIGDQVARICLNGSAKMPKFLLPSVREALDQGRPHQFLTLALAGWLRYLRGVDERGAPIDIEDPLRESLQALAVEGLANPRPLLDIHPIFGTLGDNADFVDELSAVLIVLDELGVRGALERYLSSPARP
jgi:fructuronate reductase/mannitol 2-dehydrogenase